MSKDRTSMENEIDGDLSNLESLDKLLESERMKVLEHEKYKEDSSKVPDKRFPKKPHKHKKVKKSKKEKKSKRDRVPKKKSKEKDCNDRSIGLYLRSEKSKKKLKQKPHVSEEVNMCPSTCKENEFSGMTLINWKTSNQSHPQNQTKGTVSHRQGADVDKIDYSDPDESSSGSSVKVVSEEKHEVVMLSDTESIIDDCDETLRKRLNASIHKARLKLNEVSDQVSLCHFAFSIQKLNLFHEAETDKKISTISFKDTSNFTSSADISNIPFPELCIVPPISTVGTVSENVKTKEKIQTQKKGKKMDIKISETSVAIITSGVRIGAVDENKDAPTNEEGSKECHQKINRKRSRWSRSRSNELVKKNHKATFEIPSENKENPSKMRSKSRSLTRESSRSGRSKKKRSRSPSKNELNRKRHKSNSNEQSRRSVELPGSKCKEKTLEISTNELRKSKENSRKKSSDRSRRRSRGRAKSKEKSGKRSRERSMRSRERSGSRINSKSPEKPRRKSQKKRSRSRERSRIKYRSRERSKRKSQEKSRRRSQDRSRKRSQDRRKRFQERSKDSDRGKRSTDRDAEPACKIDKARLRQIAIKNALKNATIGTGPPVSMKPVDVVIYKTGGKSLEELTEFCKKISEVTEEDIKEIVGGSAQCIDEEEMPFIPARTNKDMKSGPVKSIITLQEKLAQVAQMSSLFPVSSGSQHRDKESEESFDPDKILPVVLQPTNSMGSEGGNSSEVVQQKPALSKEDLPTTKWVAAKDIPGQFTGSTGVQLLSQQELSGSYQLWAKKDTLNNAPPVTGGIGKILLQRMGWKEGEGLGKNNEGMKVPLSIDVKTDRKGLVTPEEDPDRIKRIALERAMIQQAMLKQVVMQQQAMIRQALLIRQQLQNNQNASRPLLQMPLLSGVVPMALRMPTARPPLLPMPTPQINSGYMDLTNKHPVSALTEICSKRHWSPPEFILLEESGPAHNKMFKFKIILNGEEYVSPSSSLQKKTAKLEAAVICLQKLGLIP